MQDIMGSILTNPDITAAILLGGITKYGIDLLEKGISEHVEEISPNTMKIVAALICLLVGLILSVAEGLTTNILTVQDLAQNIVIVLASSQVIHGFLRKRK